MLDIAIKLVIIAHVVVSLLMILVILMQRPKQEGLGAAFGAGMTDAAFGAKTTDVLQKGTVYFATLFFLLSLTLGILMGKQNSIKGFSSDGAPKVETPVGAEEETPISPIEGEPIDLPGPAGQPASTGQPEATDEPEPVDTSDSVEDPETTGEPDPAGDPGPAEGGTDDPSPEAGEGASDPSEGETAGEETPTQPSGE